MLPFTPGKVSILGIPVALFLSGRAERKNQAEKSRYREFAPARSARR
jgi:hypothetical protein